jgi:Flp pilus assembly protein TadD
MHIPTYKIILNTTLVTLSIGAFSLAYAFELGDLGKVDNDKGSVASSDSTSQKDVSGKSKKKKPVVKEADDLDLTTLQKQARDYRKQGFEAQSRGDLQNAMSFYQKAIEFDANYPIPYNDLGVIYERNGEIDRAEKSYQSAIQADPGYLSAYSNLALVYENNRDLKNAAYYWGKRAELGEAGDPWTVKARERYNDIRIVTGEVSADPREEQLLDLVKDVSAKKELWRKDNKELAKHYLEEAETSFRKGDEVRALKKAQDAQQLDPTNENIIGFIDKLRIRLLSK